MPLIRKSKKKTFLLIEVLIAFSLVMTILFPLLKPLIAIQREEREKMEKMQLDREFFTFLVDLKAELFEQKIPWENLEKGVLCGTLDSKTLIAIGNLQKSFQRIYSIAREDHCNKKSFNSKFLLLDVKCIFQEEKNNRNRWEYTTTILVEKVLS